MVVASSISNNEKIVPNISIPIIDMTWRREMIKSKMVKACEEFGFFKVVNHGVPKEVTNNMENSAKAFFSLTVEDKKKVGFPPNPLGYGSKTIGFNGDTGELEYLLLHANPNSMPQAIRSVTCKNDTSNLSDMIQVYVQNVRQLACEILDMLGEGLELGNKLAFSRLLRDSESDSLIRLNNYPPCYSNNNNINKALSSGVNRKANDRIGFGEHTDPQILSILRSNDVDGLQVLTSSVGAPDVWIQVAADPAAFFVNVGDTLEALTNGRFVSVRHRVMANPCTSRLSMIYFGAPPLNARISPLPEMITQSRPKRFRPFTWSEYKNTMYKLRLSHNRLGLFQAEDDEVEGY